MQQEDWSICGKVCLITGGASGIGRSTAIGLMRRGLGKIIIADVDVDLAQKVASEIRTLCGFGDEKGSQRVVVKHLDLASLASVRQLAEDVKTTEPRLHLLINNAGINPPADRRTTIDNFELTFQVNFLGHFLLTNLLLDLLKASSPSRIVAVASDGYKFCWPTGLRLDDLQIEKRKFDFWDAYCHSKLCVMLTMRRLSETLKAERAQVSVFLVHPGMVKTNVLKNRSKSWQTFVDKIVHPFKFIVVTADRGAETSLKCATKPGLERYSGKYFVPKRPVGVWSMAKDKDKAEKLWQLSLQFCKLESF